jgi:alpha-1,2-mannosyltransferase
MRTAEVVGEATTASAAAWRRLIGPVPVAAVAWLLALVPVGLMVWRDVAGSMLDLDVYRAGALSVLHGTDLYTIRGAHRLLFTYPPISAVLGTPLLLVPFGIDKIAWIAMVYGPLALAIRFGIRPLLVRAGVYAPAVFGAIFGCTAMVFPMQQEIYFGQIDIFLLALCLIDCAVERPRWPRGLLIGLATAIKLVPGVFIVYLLITGRRRAAGVATMSFAGWTLAALAIAPADSRIYWTSAIFQSKRLGGNAAASNQSLRGMLLRAFQPQAMPVWLWIAVAAIVAIAGYAAARACWRNGNDMAGMAITGLLGVALAPVAWVHHMCWIIVAIGVVAGECRNWRRVVTAMLALGLFLTTTPVLTQDHLLANHDLPIVAGRLLEDSFGLAALVLIVIMVKIRATPAELRAWQGGLMPGVGALAGEAAARAPGGPAAAGVQASPGGPAAAGVQASPGGPAAAGVQVNPAAAGVQASPAQSDAPRHFGLR